MTSRKPKAKSSRLRQFLMAALLVTTVIALGGSGAQRAVAVAPAAASSGDLTPSERHRRVMRLVTEVVDRQHYRQAVLDDNMSSQIYELYLEALDGGHSLFLQSDVADFVREYLANLTGVDPGDDPIVLPPLVTVVARRPAASIVGGSG